MLTSRGHGSAAWDGRSFLGSSQPGTRAPSQSGLRHQVIELTAAPGRSPSCCIPLTDLDCSTGDGKRQERKFLTRFTIYFPSGKVKFAPGFVHDFKTADFAWIHRYFSCIPCSLLTALCSPPIAKTRIPDLDHANVGSC